MQVFSKVNNFDEVQQKLLNKAPLGMTKHSSTSTGFLMQSLLGINLPALSREFILLLPLTQPRSKANTDVVEPIPGKFSQDHHTFYSSWCPLKCNLTNQSPNDYKTKWLYMDIGRYNAMRAAFTKKALV